MLGGESPSIQPATPYGLWSLWDMLEAYGHVYFRGADELATARGKLHAWALQHPGECHLPRGGDVHRLVIAALHRAAAACASVPLGRLSREIDRAINEHGKAVIVDRCGVALRNVAERFHDELEDKKFLHVPNEFASFYDQDELFGKDVFEKFKDSRADIKNAGNCYALGQPTACVFHVMRSMEIVVRKLARRPHMEITITPKTTWRMITGAMDKKIAAMPDGNIREKKRKENWEEARANLHHVGSVWRNSTMHPAKTYTQPQARDVLDACRVFMSGLCAL
jgi:hypothetical protein